MKPYFCITAITVCLLVLFLPAMGNHNPLEHGEYDLNSSSTIGTTSEQSHPNNNSEWSIDLTRGDDPTITIMILPQIDSINMSATQTFIITITSEGEPVEGVELDIKASLGSTTGVTEVGGGEYSFTYNAPDDEEGNTERVRIDAEKDGYEDARKEFTFTVGYGDTGPARETTLDGVVSDGEYTFSASFKSSKVTVHWKVQDTTIAMALVGKTSGWLAIGFDPSRAMNDADMVIGWVDTSGVHVVDAFSTGSTGPHPPDTDLGGTDDLLDVGGSEEGGITTIEFIRELEAVDKYDKTIPKKGDLKIIWATGSSDSFGNQHSGTTRGTGTISLDTGKSSEEDDVLLWPIHALFMTLGLISMLVAIYIAKFKKEETWWLGRHKKLGITGAISTIVGLIIGFYMIADSTGEHFRVPHAFFGLATIILAILTPTIGLSMFKFIKYINTMKPLHRWLGRVTATLMIITIISGLNEAGVI